MNSLTIVDYSVLGVIGLSVLLSVWRGFMREVLSLAAWIVAFLIAFMFADAGAAYLAAYVSVPSVRIILAFGGLFLVTLFIGGLINILVAQLVKTTGLSGTDRMIGIVFGVVRGVAIIGLLVLLAGLTPLPSDPWWNESLLLPRFQPMALWLRGLLPPELAEHFSFPT